MQGWWRRWLWWKVRRFGEARKVSRVVSGVLVLVVLPGVVEVDTKNVALLNVWGASGFRYRRWFRCRRRRSER